MISGDPLIPPKKGDLLYKPRRPRDPVTYPARVFVTGWCVGVLSVVAVYQIAVNWS